MKYFSIKELCHSTTAQQRGVDNTVSDIEIANLSRLVEDVLDPLREWWGKPIMVNSGFRNMQVNTLVEGAKNSYHTKGMAADIDTRTIEGNRLLWQYIKDNLPFTELIWENGGEWVHVAWDGKTINKTLK